MRVFLFHKENSFCRQCKGKLESADLKVFWFRSAHLYGISCCIAVFDFAEIIVLLTGFWLLSLKELHCPSFCLSRCDLLLKMLFKSPRFLQADTLELETIGDVLWAILSSCYSRFQWPLTFWKPHIDSIKSNQTFVFLKQIKISTSSRRAQRFMDLSNYIY